MFRRIWGLFWRPSTRWGGGVLALFGAIAGLALWGGFHTFLEYTNRIEFCVSCHEMNDTVYQEYQKTVHFQNMSGVQATCADCHVPKSLGPKLVAKVKASKDVWGHMTGIIDTKEKFEDYRLTMASSVWAYMEATDSRECRSCHSFTAMAVDKQNADAQKMHPTALKEGETCISCHKGIAHTLPDLSGGYKKRFKELQQLAVKEGAKGNLLYPIKEILIYQDKDLAQSGGRVLPATSLTVLERSGDAIKVRIDGWQQENVRPAIYALRGKRIFQAGLQGDMVDRVKVSDPEVDPDTGIQWSRASLEGWVKKEDLISDLAPIWEYGSEMYTANCNTCHKAPAPDHNLANQWGGIVDAMKRFITIDQEQNRFLVKYLQLHASDTVGHASNQEGKAR